MQKNNMTIKIGGEAGQGMDTSGAGFGRALVRAGLHIFANSDFMSRIRGGYNVYQLRVSDKPVYGPHDDVHLLLAFNQEAIDQHLNEIAPGGAIVHDVSIKVDPAMAAARQVSSFAFPFEAKALEIGRPAGMDPKHAKLMLNTAALGATAAITGFPFDRIADVIRQNFGKKKGSAIAEANLAIAQWAHDQALEYAGHFGWKLAPIANDKPQMIVNGNQAIGLGAIAAGCKFMSAYPMTPATSIIEFITSQAKRFNIVTKQTEDELAAILFAIGAGQAGVRALTATSGGGFSLMTEALGMAGMAETPLVVVDSQRPGPSTGMPTRTGQGDLLFLLHASQDEFPRIVLAPGGIEACYSDTARAFNLAEKYQCPVLILTEGFQAFASRSLYVEEMPFEEFVIDRGKTLTDADLERLTPGEYKRYAITEDGISPRAIQGHPNAVFTVTSDEHTETGRIEDEDAANRIAQHEKRMRKVETMKKEMRMPEWYGPRNAPITLMGWGATRYAIREAVDILNADGVKVNALHFTDIYPLDEARLAKELAKAQHLIDVEGNFTAQLAQVVRTYTGRLADDRILKYDGRPFSGIEIANTLRIRLKHDRSRTKSAARENGHDGRHGKTARKTVRRRVHA
ncbi:MAG: 2-oxoacid:acceptor oxidoreductase subunit alpha [Chloroflexi bacterium]|nr:2-oxoacid:acceptor oxidoreductase subunit alpha [Chloroflexota bacterium]